MKNNDIDDIFRDFESKVEGEKETGIPQKEHSEEEVLKRKYWKAEQALKEKHKKEREHLESIKAQEMLKRGKVPTKIISNIERVSYIGIIVVLAAFIAIDLSFFQGGKSRELSTGESITAAAVVEDEQAEIEEVEEETVEEATEEEIFEEEKTFSGEVTLTIDKAYTEILDEDMGEISKVVFTIDNDKDKILTPLVEVYAYDTKCEEDYETKSRGKYLGIAIKPGDKQTGTIDLYPKILGNLDLKKNIRLVLNDTREGFITAARDTVYIT